MNTLETKSIWTADEVCSYTGWSKGKLYTLTHRGEIPFHKPTGRTLFFKADEIKEWLLTGRHEALKEENR